MAAEDLDLALVQAHLRDPKLSISDVADRVGVHEAVFSKQFALQVGMSPEDWRAQHCLPPESADEASDTDAA
ncbi:MAG TPA: helix-turn-helix transcriptional regulator [Nannocystis sp.]|jgi:AraC-like DNA-binding protein